MSADAWTVALILLGTVAAFAFGRIRPEAIAVAAVLALSLTGVASPAQAFAGFSDPTVVTIAALFVLSTALERTGVAGRAGRGLLALVGRRETALIAAIMAAGGVTGALMNVVASTAVLLPVVIAVCRETGISPSRLLMPLAVASRLGGAMTLIGKPTNLVVSSMLVQAGHPPLGFWAFLPVGLPLLAVGTLFMVTAGRRLLPARVPEGFTWSAALRRDLSETYRLPERLFRIRVTAGSPLDGRSIGDSGLGEDYGVVVVGITRGRRQQYAPTAKTVLRPGDELLVEARPEDADRLRAAGPIDIAPEPGERQRPLETDEIGLAEVVIAPRSDFGGKTLREIEFRQRYGLNVLAIWQQGRPRRTWLADLPLQYGDALLLQGPRERLQYLRQDPNFVSLDRPYPLRIRRAPYALLGVAALLVLGTSGAMPISLAALLAAGVVIAGGAVSTREALEAVDWPTILVIGGLLPVGEALQRTGAAQAIAALLLPAGAVSPFLVLTIVVLAAMVVGHAIPSVPTAIVMAPIALSAATTVGVSPVPFLIAVASTTSITLVTPISHPVSLMVMGPGGYRFADYSRVGAPLALLLTATLLAAVWLVWPL